MHPALRLLSLALPFLLGCSAAQPPAADPMSTVAAQQQRWQAANVDDYRFHFQQQCFCVREQVQPVIIEVRDGQIARVLSRETGQEVARGENLRWYTIADLFGLVSEARQNGREPLVVRYDPQLGYPTHIEIGTLANDAGVIYSASNLQPLP